MALGNICDMIFFANVTMQLVIDTLKRVEEVQGQSSMRSTLVWKAVQEASCNEFDGMLKTC